MLALYFLYSLCSLYGAGETTILDELFSPKNIYFPKFSKENTEKKINYAHGKKKI